MVLAVESSKAPRTISPSPYIMPFFHSFPPSLTGHVLLTPQSNSLCPSNAKNPFTKVSSSCHWSKRQFSSEKVREPSEVSPRISRNSELKGSTSGPIAFRKMANI
ncbi:hypothetical protein AVEN_63790-1 [Araneus ventricosus]|uniref:Uncharacterized protein n=1 Tax=Araneus ventricosus TaxID=182803 RepID=A0A4Y2H015_ARAVE|nr:hypothetical protein AVEN_63790-1 [Araneus ventricosus]